MTKVQAPLPTTPETELPGEQRPPGLAELEATVSAVEARLRAERDTLRTRYEAARPFPHLALDGLFDPAVLGRVAAEFPRPAERDWVAWKTPHEDKATSRGLVGVPRFAQLLLLLLNSEPFVAAVRGVTGIDDLVPDPLFYGAGLQAAERGGRLDIHSDYIHHPVLGLSRRLNLLLYLNRDWDPAWGGDLELWDRATLARGASYPPLFNRTILFPTTEDTLHGHPVRLTCPPERSRQLISVYYWSVLPPHAPASAGLLRKLQARARRAAHRAAVRLHWRGPRFYDVGSQGSQGRGEGT